MSLSCIQDADLEQTGFHYTMSLIQGEVQDVHSLHADGLRRGPVQ